MNLACVDKMASEDFLYLALGCVLSVGFWAKPLITNATVSLKQEIPV